MRGGGVKKEPTASQIGLYQGFLKEIRQKVHRLLYHSLCTHVAAGEGFELSKRVKLRKTEQKKALIINTFLKLTEITDKGKQFA